ncbi:MAG: PRD domain-containing protein [Erysipelotrichaceae bacterium]|jgi:beta-glucoside operon transcriptional antiterminator|nr:PRD domain-containing protein [Erysipelotrichaceae bacterium]
MKVIKSINNNVAHCYDAKGREVIVFGKGIGFYKTGEEVPLARINRTFYNIKDTDYGVIKTIPDVIINTAIYIIDYVSDELSLYFPSSSALTLADHLQFAIVRKNENIYLPQPMIQDIYQLYPDEMRVALECLKIIERMTGEKLPRLEAGTLAMHFINDRIQTGSGDTMETVKTIDYCTNIVEEHFKVTLDRESFNYSRFVTHLDYLFRRLNDHQQIESQNNEVFEKLREQYPDSMECAGKMKAYINERFAVELNDEELMYLVIHINRLISRIE